jgi:hypothetical protein
VRARDDEHEGQAVAAQALHAHLALRQLRRHVARPLRPAEGGAPAAVLEEHGGRKRHIVAPRAQEALQRRV